MAETLDRYEFALGAKYNYYRSITELLCKLEYARDDSHRRHGLQNLAIARILNLLKEVDSLTGPELLTRSGLEMSERTFYNALHACENRDWVTRIGRLSAGRQAQVYTITDKGREQLLGPGLLTIPREDLMKAYKSSSTITVEMKPGQPATFQRQTRRNVRSLGRPGETQKVATAKGETIPLAEQRICPNPECQRLISLKEWTELVSREGTCPKCGVKLPWVLEWKPPM